MFTPSRYQQLIEKMFQDFNSNLIVQAVAGSGKTTTLKLLSKSAPKRSIFLAFNKAIVSELKEKLAPMTCSTIHSLGMKAVTREFGRVKVENDKVPNLIKGYFTQIVPKGMYSNEFEEFVREVYPVSQIKNMVSKFKNLSITNPTIQDTIMILDKYGIDFDPFFYDELYDVCLKVFKKSNSITSHIDFDDMIFFPKKFNLSTGNFDCVFVDEAQDLSPSRLDVVLRATSSNGRYVFVGDSKQAIYGFAGAMTDSMGKIQKATNALELPLSECYRCPKNHIELVKNIVPQIEGNKPEGIIKTLAKDKVVDFAQEEDLILCRINAPLVSMCFSFLKRKKKAVIRGRDIGQTIVRYIKDAVKKENDLDKLPDLLNLHFQKKRDKLLKIVASNSPRIQTLTDQHGCVMAFYEATEKTTISGLISEIRELFTDKTEGIILSTVHRAKGLEAETVFILRPELMPLPNVEEEWQFEQEMNLKYVALTRSKNALIFIDGE